ncbi:MAG TPA: hypothetical protein VMS22_24160 [Candidatus Eisenbacteria bacterium]|nr:hypothetical protein [Candidatus Eisenbacteria bacterium]
MKVRHAHAALLAALVLVATACGHDDTAAARPASQTEAPSVWPPRVGEPYPDLHLVDQTGRLTALSSFKGSVILVEMIGMTCPACQGFSGAKRLGTFGGVESDGGLPAIDELVPQYARGVTFPSDDLVFVQILLFDMKLGAPTEDDARAWAQHFGRDVAKHQYVLAGGPALHNDASFVMVPGFQLIDRRFVLRWDATGHSPRHNLYTQLLPAIPALLKDG